jgi:hypothetical protein
LKFMATCWSVVVSIIIRANNLSIPSGTLIFHGPTRSTATSSRRKLWHFCDHRYHSIAYQIWRLKPALSVFLTISWWKTGSGNWTLEGNHINISFRTARPLVPHGPCRLAWTGPQLWSWWYSRIQSYIPPRSPSWFSLTTPSELASLTLGGNILSMLWFLKILTTYLHQ